MLDAKHEAEVEIERAGWAPSPPIRDGSAPAPGGASGPPTEPVGTPVPAMAAGASVAAPAPTAAPVDPAEVTRTLNSLADLRDRGAISAEEYESKKAELLRRL